MPHVSLLLFLIDGIVDATTPEGRYLLSRVGPVRASPFRFRLHSSEVKFWWNPFTHGEAPHFQTRLKSVTCQKRAQDFKIDQDQECTRQPFFLKKSKWYNHPVVYRFEPVLFTTLTCQRTYLLSSRPITCRRVSI
jgi:hypothetical protein